MPTDQPPVPLVWFDLRAAFSVGFVLLFLVGSAWLSGNKLKAAGLDEVALAGAVGFVLGGIGGALWRLIELSWRLRARR